MDKRENKNHFALYGRVVIPRVFCKNCKEYSLIINNKSACCEESVDLEEIKETKRMTAGESIRRMLPAKIKLEILESQNNQCIYCEMPFGSLVRRGNKSIYLKRHYDHSIPFSYSQDNSCGNFVASCQICNLSKNNLMFSTLEEAKTYLALKRHEKGYNF